MPEVPLSSRFTQILTGAAIVAAPLLAGPVSSPEIKAPGKAPGIVLKGDDMKLRDDLAFANDFVHVLMKSGLRVRSADQSLYNDFFEDAHQAARVNTDAGTVEVVLFPYAVATKVKVTRQYDAEGGVYLYAVQRHPGADGTTTIDSPCRSAVMMSGRWFILTDSPKAAQALAQALKPTLPTNLPGI